MKTGKIAFYYRVSTGGQNLDSQRVELQRYAEQRGWKPDDILTFEDHAVSGGVFSRKGLDEMMKAVKRGKIRAVVCSRLDRLGRSLSGVAMLLSELQASGVGLICCQQGLNTSDDSPMGRLRPGFSPSSENLKSHCAGSGRWQVSQQHAQRARHLAGRTRSPSSCRMFRRFWPMGNAAPLRFPGA